MRLEKWSRSVHDRLRGARDLRDRRRSQAEPDPQSLIAWEAIMGLERLHRHLRIHKEPARHRGRILRVAGELLGVQSLAWVSLQGDEEVVFEGDRLLSPWDCGQLANLLTNQASWGESGYVLINEAGEKTWGARFPRIRNLLAIPVAETKLSGWILAFNKLRALARGPNGRASRLPRAAEPGESGPDAALTFRRSDAALLIPFASLLGLHARGPALSAPQGPPGRTDPRADRRDRRQGFVHLRPQRARGARRGRAGLAGG